MRVGDTGLVLEGGAMRGMFTAGVLDVFMESGLWFDNTVGISAGAVFGCNYKSHQIGRTVRYNKRFCQNRYYCSWWSWLTTGDLYGADFGYRRIPFELDKFDTVAYQADPMRFWVGATDLSDGRCVFHECVKGDEYDILWMRASASMPVVSRDVVIDGHHYLDGGVADAIPLDFMEEQGFKRNVVLLTQPAGFVKEPNSMLPIIRMKYKKRAPALVEAMETRHTRYNKTLEVIRSREAEGSVFCIRPPEALGVKSVVKDPDELERVYQVGRRTGESVLHPLMDFLGA